VRLIFTSTNKRSHHLLLPLALAVGLIASTTLAKAESAPDSITPPTFSRDVLPILQAHCQDCHRPGQVAPMSLLDYGQVRPWSKAIRKAVSERSMPPFRANAPLGHFQNDPRLSESAIDLLLRWVDAGAPQGDPADAPAPLSWHDSEWAMGKPDLVLEFPEYISKTNNKDEEVILYSDYVFPQNTWIQAVELRSTDHTLLHHAGIDSADNTFFFPKDNILDSEDEELETIGGVKGVSGGASAINLLLIKQRALYTWLPGERVHRRPDGEGFRVLKGDRIVLQAHFAPSAEAVPQKISLGILFVNGVIKSHSLEYVAGITDLRIPPGAADHQVRRWVDVKKPVTVTGFNLHMHLRGKSAQILFHYPDGRTEVGLDVPHYDFNWQRIYYLKDPLRIPGGSRIEFVGLWDNSPANPLNPDPTAEVVYGGRTVDEMYTGNVYYSVARLHPLVVQNGVATAVVDEESPGLPTKAPAGMTQ